MYNIKIVGGNLMERNTGKTIATIAITTASVAVISVACTVWLRLRQEKKKIGGELIKVNYKYEKEFAE